jgi:transcriptional regulator with XRE-family HTH domain
MEQVTATPVQRARLEKGLTLQQLAAACSEQGAPISEGQLSRIDRGQMVPRPKLRAVLAEVLGLDVVVDFEKSRSEPADPPTADVDMRNVRDGERAVQGEVPELSDARVKRTA